MASDDTKPTCPKCGPTFLVREVYATKPPPDRCGKCRSELRHEPKPATPREQLRKSLDENRAVVESWSDEVRQSIDTSDVLACPKPKPSRTIWEVARAAKERVESWPDRKKRAADQAFGTACPECRSSPHKLSCSHGPSKGVTVPVSIPEPTERWCPYHGKHGDWMSPDMGEYRCGRQNCWADPIAPDVVAAIKQREYERGLADGAGRERAAVVEYIRAVGARWRKSFLPGAAHSVRANMCSGLKTQIAMGTHIDGPDPLAEHAARVQEQAKLDAMVDLASWLGINPGDTDDGWRDSYTCARNALRDQIEIRWRSTVNQAPKCLEGEDEQ